MIIFQYLYLMDLYFRKKNDELDDSDEYFSAIITLFLAFFLAISNILAFCGILDHLLKYRVSSGLTEYLILLITVVR